MFLLYHAYVYLEFLILACTIYILAPCITVDSKDGSDADGMMDIMTLNGALNMPDSLFTEMCATNSLMGRQSETYDNIEVEWSYHPDNGLDVFFKIEM